MSLLNRCFFNGSYLVEGGGRRGAKGGRRQSVDEEGGEGVVQLNAVADRGDGGEWMSIYRIKHSQFARSPAHT